MGMLVSGKWEKSPLILSDKQGNFIRKDSVFRNFITRDGNSGFKAEANRYHLYISYACPWACRTLIFWQLKGLTDIISLSTVEPFMGDRGWEFGSKHALTEDPINHARYLYEIYLKAAPRCTSKVTVPVLWDKFRNTLVNNESAEIIRMLNSEFSDYAKNPYDYYPVDLRKEIDEINAFIYETINNGVYRCGFATSQQAYDAAFDKLFSALEKMDQRLGQQRYLIGNQLTEADWRLFTTLIRFDAVYYSHFKCNLKPLEDFSNLANYLRDLYQQPGIKATVKFDHIKEHYYRSQTSINPTGIVPKGPLLNYERAHNRKKLFGEENR